MGKYVKESREEDLRLRNIMYETPADVQPAYYRTADSSGLSRMESGSDYKTAELKSSNPQSPKTPSGHPSGRTGTPIPVKTNPQPQSPRNPTGGSVKVSAPPQEKSTPHILRDAKFYLPPVNTEKEIKLRRRKVNRLG